MFFFFPLPTYRMVEVSAEIALFWAQKRISNHRTSSSGNKMSPKSFDFPNDIDTFLIIGIKNVLPQTISEECHNNVIFLFEIQIIFYRSWDKKSFCPASRPLSGQKIPRNGPQAKRVWPQCKKFFCPSSYKIWSVFRIKI